MAESPLWRCVLSSTTPLDAYNNQTERYSYDATSQLTGVEYSPGKTETFAYDAVGNRTEVGRVIPNAPRSTEIYTSGVLLRRSQPLRPKKILFERLAGAVGAKRG